MNFALLITYVLALPGLVFVAAVLLDHLIHGRNT